MLLNWSNGYGFRLVLQAGSRYLSLNQCQFVECGPYMIVDICYSYSYHGWYLYQIQETVINAFLSSPDAA